MPNLDLKAAAAARAEMTKEDPPTVTFPDGKVVELPAEPSIAVAETLMHLAGLDPEDTTGKSMELMVQLGREMLGPKLYKQFLSSGATLQDLMDLGAGFGTLYRFVTQGESPASPDSSSESSEPSRQTSSVTTG